MTPPSAGYFLQSQRLGFRLWRPDDGPLAQALWADPTVTRLVADLGQPSAEQASRRLELEIATWQEYRLQYWPVFLLDGGAHVGCCGLRPYQPQQGVFEIGVHLRPEYWRRGLAAEAVRCVMAHAFGPLGLRALFARHNPMNHASTHLLTRLGFRHTHDDFMPQTGLNHPAYLLTAEEYRRPSSTSSMDAAAAELMPRVVIRAEDPGCAAVRQLIEKLDAYQNTLYPPESLHLLPIESLRHPDVTFLVAVVNEEIVGCGAAVNQRGDYAEIKRMFVQNQHRGLGIGRRILELLEARVRYLGLRIARLETGVKQPEALRLYESMGYRPRGPFGDYPEDALTVYMEKELTS